LLGIFVVYPYLLFAQETGNKKFEIGIHSGFSVITTTDHLINYFNYHSSKGIPFMAYMDFTQPKYQCRLEFRIGKTALSPANANLTLYNQNIIDHHDFELNTTYFHSVFRLGHITFYGGIAGNSYFVYQELLSENILIGKKIKRSAYDFSVCNISPAIKTDFTCKKHRLYLHFHYVLLNLVARPDDNYVKQSGYDSKPQWALFTPADYLGYNINVQYQYTLSRSFSISGGYYYSYRGYHNADTYHYLRKSFLLGISKAF
jgi:hypothetical protein